MATNESGFKQEFKKSATNIDGLFMWAQNDRYKCGLPDIAAVYKGKHISIEAKFVTRMPQKDTSKVLQHELSDLQHVFLQHIEASGGVGVLLIGFGDVAVAFRGKDLKSNYTAEEVRQAPRIYKDGGKWDIHKFLEVLGL